MNTILQIKKIRSAINTKGELIFSRKEAKRLRQQLVKKRGKTVVNYHTKKLIKLYAKEVFGSANYWPWLALYTDIRGEFIEGWLPNDYYTVFLLKKDHSYFSGYLSDFKTLDHKIFPDIAIKPLLIIARGNIYDSDGAKMRNSDVKSFMRSYNDEVVIKKNFGLGGKQVHVVHSKKFDLNFFSREATYVVQPLIRQHEDLSRVSPYSVNTLRIVTSMNLSGEVDVKYAWLRFGVGNSRVDNSSSGGGSCMIGKNGKLDNLAYNLIGDSLGKFHPTTDCEFNKIIIPNYQDILDLCVENHHKVPYGKIIGWDIAVNRDSQPVLIEWNLDPFIWATEALYGPFWHEEVRELPNINRKNRRY